MFHVPAHKNVTSPAGQVATRTLWMNVYRSGWFHREGKPDTLDCHAGDFYETREAAEAAIDPPHHYVATVSFELTAAPALLRANAADSTPVPLSESRRRFANASH